MTAADDCADSDVHLAHSALADGTRVRFDAAGDSGVIAIFSHGEDVHRWANAQGLARGLRAILGTRARTVVAAYDSVFVDFDGERCTVEQIAGTMQTLARSAPFPIPVPHHRIVLPMVYGGEFGPDLPAVADHLSLTEQDVIAAHCRTAFVVRTVGSPPGSPLMDAPASLRGVPRRIVPRAQVPAGSLALAGLQSTIYATPSPGGWQLIGRTPVTLMELGRTDPVRVAPGDLIEFRPIPARRWSALSGAAPLVCRG